jgi:hypothetical protein
MAETVTTTPLIDSLPKLTGDFRICIRDKGVLPTIQGRLTQR